MSEPVQPIGGTTPGRPGTEATQRHFAADVTVRHADGRGFAAFQADWGEQIGETYPLPPFTPERTSGFRISVHASKLLDAAIADVHSELLHGTTDGTGDHCDDLVLVHIITHGTWHFAESSDAADVALTAGQYLIQCLDRPSFEVAPNAAAKVLILPGAPLRRLIGDRQIIGSAEAADMRLLLAHANMIHSTQGDLGRAGAHAAQAALLELTKGLLHNKVDRSEPRLAIALAQAARQLADNHLADPELSPQMLARELHVSVRTLHRAFAVSDESVAAYIHRRRLEQARLELISTAGRPTISELAAHWQFADSSHFIRAFKNHYGHTPTHALHASTPPSSLRRRPR